MEKLNNEHFQTTSELPSKDAILSRIYLLNDATEPFALARAALEAVQVNIRRLSAPRDLLFTEMGSFIARKGERYLRLSAGEAEVLRLCDETGSTRAELSWRGSRRMLQRLLKMRRISRGDSCTWISTRVSVLRNLTSGSRSDGEA